MNKETIVNEILSSQFDRKVYDILNDMHWDILNNNPEDFDGKWDSNPYGVESQLATGSGCWEFSEEAEAKAFETAKDKMLEAIDNAELDIFAKYKPLEDVFGGDYNAETDEAWLKALLKYVVNKATN